MNSRILNAGNLSNTDDVFRLYDTYLKHLSGDIKILDTKLELDLRFIQQGKINLFALVSLLSVFERISRTHGYPIPIHLNWDPYVIKFLDRIQFFDIARKMGIFWFDDRFLGGYPYNEFNPNTKIYAFSSIRNIPDYQDDKFELFKENLRLKFENDLGAKIESLFFIRDRRTIYDLEHTVKLLIKVSAELLVNALIHGKTSAFIGLQRSSKRISISIADSGVGFSKSLKNSNPWVNQLKLKSNADYTALGCMIKENGDGLKQAIEAILNSRGHVKVSSNENELILRSVFWNYLIAKYSEIRKPGMAGHIAKIVPRQFEKIPEQYFYSGYCRKYMSFVDKKIQDEKIVYSESTPLEVEGCRISFEIPINF